jgi:hypothetical protein
MAVALGLADSRQTSDGVVTSTHEAPMKQFFRPLSSICLADTPAAG